MKKVIAAGLALAVLFAVAFGRDVVDFVRLLAFVESSTQAHEANGGPWPQLADVCTGCHGVQGNSRHQAYASLAGQPAAYLAAQLRNFAAGQRASPTMGPLAMTLSEAEITFLADHFARQTVNQNTAFVPDAAMSEKGRQLVANGACAACHGERLAGRDQNPRLAGQGYDYLVAQLEAFAVGRRNDPTGTMQKLAAAMSPEDRQAIATFLASSN